MKYLTILIIFLLHLTAKSEQATKLNNIEDNNPLPLTSQSESYSSIDYKAKRYPLKIYWSQVKNADHYIVEITRVKSCTQRYFKVSKNKFDIVIYPNANYIWRVAAQTKDRGLTEYSSKFNLYLEAPIISGLKTKYYDYEESIQSGNTQASDLCNLTSKNKQFADHQTSIPEDGTSPITTSASDSLQDLNNEATR